VKGSGIDLGPAAFLDRGRQRFAFSNHVLDGGGEGVARLLRHVGKIRSRRCDTRKIRE